MRRSAGDDRCDDVDADDSSDDTEGWRTTGRLQFDVVRSETIVDSRGRPCPLPVIDLARAIADVPIGDAVKVLADDPGAANDIPAWCRMRGQQLSGVTDEGDHHAYVVTRSS